MQPRNGKMGGKGFPERLAKVGHLFKPVGLTQVNPFENLACPKGSHALLFKTILQVPCGCNF